MRMYSSSMEELCPWCKKPKPTRSSGSMLMSFDNVTQQWTLLSAEVYPMPDYLCSGHEMYECEVCGWNVPYGYHTLEDCKRISKLVGKTKRTAIPDAFYKAFASES